MPGKVNPVIPEAVSQAAMLVMGYDATIAQAAAAGSLELNPFLPLIAACLLESLLLLQRACLMLRRPCVEGIVADEARLPAPRRRLVGRGHGAGARDRLRRRLRSRQGGAPRRGATVRAAAVDGGFVTAARFDELLSAEAVCRLGTPTPARQERRGMTEARDHEHARARPRACACTSACSAAATSASRAC